LAAASLALLVLAGYLWLSLVGGCEDFGSTCHHEYSSWLLVVLALAIGALIELVRRGFRPAPPGHQQGPARVGAAFAGVVLLALCSFARLVHGLL
jgi:hypothetical protein